MQNNWLVEEVFGRDWAPEVVWRPMAVAPGPAYGVRIDDGQILPAQVDGDHLAFITDLPAQGSRRFQVVETATAPQALPLRVDEDAVIATGGAGLHLATGTAPVDQCLTGLQCVDGRWADVQASWTGVSVTARQDEILAHGAVLTRLRQIFHLADGVVVELTWELDAASPAVRLDVAVQGETEGSLSLHLGAVCAPEKAYWRPHSPRPWRGELGTHKRQAYTIAREGAAGQPSGDEIEIGPFYNWARDAASYWTCWGDRAADLLYIGWVRPSRTRLTGPLQRLRVQAHPGRSQIDLHIPLQQGRRRLALARLDRTNLHMPLHGGGGDIDRLHRSWNGPGLDDLMRMDLQAAAAAAGEFPRLWLQSSQVNSARGKLATWPWLRDPPAEADVDAAGTFLATGDNAWAATAIVQLTAELDELVELLLDYGPSVDAALGISMSRRLRALTIHLDLVLGASTTSGQVRVRILRQLAFVTHVQWLEDAWPADDSGIPRGNQNFHPDVISARGMAAAMLDGHPRQAQWLGDAVAEMAAFLQSYHFPSGACQEAATYQLVSLGYALQLHTAAARRGHDVLANLPVLHRAFEFLAATQTPVDERCGYRMLPTIGHVTVYAWCQTLQALFGWAAHAAAGTAFSRRMMRVWRRGGGHVVSLHDYQQNLIWAPPMLLLDGDLPAATDDEDLAASQIFDGLGAVLRARHDDGSEGYLLAKMGPAQGHFDQDEGSLLWYAWGKPLLADFGTQYDPNFHAHPWLHNRISFDHKADAAPRQGRMVAQQLDQGVDYLCGEVTVTAQFFHGEWPDRDPDYDFRQAGDPWKLETAQVWRRHLIYVHALEAVVLLDEIDGTLTTDWNLQVHAGSARVQGSSVYCAGRFGVDLDVCLLQPAMPDIAVSAFSHLGFDEPRGGKGWWRAARWTTAPGTTMTNMAEQALTIRAQAGAGQPFFAALVARHAGAALARIEAVGDWGVHIVSAVGEATVRTSPPFTRWDVDVATPTGDRQVCIATER